MKQTCSIQHSVVVSVGGWKKAFLALLGFLGLLSLLLGGCSESNRPELDKSLLTDDPCAAPCWNNLVPGEATPDEVREALKSSPWVKKGSVSCNSGKLAGVFIELCGWDDRKEGRLGGNRALFAEGRLLRIDIDLDYDLTFGEVVEKFGPPEGVYARTEVREGVVYDVSLDYFSQGVTFRRVSFAPKRGEASPNEGWGMVAADFLVTEVNYYAPSTIDEIVQDVFFLTPYQQELRLRYEQQWAGFGKVELAPRD